MAYPLANLVHLFGMILLIGGIGVLDLRIMGLFRAIPLMPLSRALVPLAAMGLMFMLLSGPLLFVADAAALSRSSIFAWKLALIILALCNAAAFRLRWNEERGEPSTAFRIMACASITLWLGVACLGRLIAYF